MVHLDLSAGERWMLKQVQHEGGVHSGEITPPYPHRRYFPIRFTVSLASGEFTRPRSLAI